MTSELDLQQIPEFRRLAISWFCRFMTSGLHEFVISKLCRFEITDLRKFDVPENSFHEFHKPRRFEGDRFF
jgi:hypothetical protein